MDINKWGLGEGGYVFLSHSHKDIDKVRKIRNYLEEQGFEPLCFYLKCLEKDSEIFNLIEREIDAREWFVYLESVNSKESEWVPRELECAEGFGKAIIKIDLENEASAEEISNVIANSMRVFLSYSARDRKLAIDISNYLISKDLKVFTDMDRLTVGDWVGQINNMIVEAAKNGCVIALITENSMRSEYVCLELKCALIEGARILPIVIGDIKPADVESLLGPVKWLSFQSEEDIDMEKIYEATKEFLLAKFRREI